MWGDLSGVAILDLVASLVDKNLLRQAKALGAEARFEMLETIREYGLEVLHESGELEAAQRRHAEYFLALAEEAEPNISGQDRERWLRRLEQEHDNLRAALGWCVDRGRTGESLRLAAALGQFWQYRGYISEGRGWLQRVLASDAGAASAERAKALASAGMLALYQGEFAVARANHEQALAIHRAAEDRWSIALAINDLGTVALYQGDYAAAHTLYAESLEIRQELGRPPRHGGFVYQSRPGGAGTGRSGQRTPFA